jgi:hypothetical protein
MLFHYHCELSLCFAGVPGSGVQVQASAAKQAAGHAFVDSVFHAVRVQVVKELTSSDVAASC